MGCHFMCAFILTGQFGHSFWYTVHIYTYNTQGSYRSLKCLKVLEIHHCFFKALKSLKNGCFMSKCLNVLQFPLDNKSYNLLQSSVKDFSGSILSNSTVYRICGIPSFAILCYYLYKLKTNGPGKIFFGAGKSWESP